MAKLSIVGTPIGNLEDITLRALKVLETADLILCEDTRVTKKLLARYKVATPVMSYHEHSGTIKVQKIIALLAEDKHLALVSDAGTPGISDPGERLIAAVRQALPEAEVSPVPGPSALVAALSAAGFSADRFLFLGFLPHKKGRETLFKEIAGEDRTVVLYESPHRLTKTLESLGKHLAPGRPVAVCRELTKVFETVERGSAEELERHFREHPERARGEVVILIAPSDAVY